MRHEEKVVRYSSDVTGKDITRADEVIVRYKNIHRVVDIDAEDVENELAQLTVAMALEVGRPESSRRGARASAKTSLHTNARKWARANGVEVGARGEVPQRVIEMYQAAQARGPAGDTEDTENAVVTENTDNTEENEH